MLRTTISSLEQLFLNDLSNSPHNYRYSSRPRYVVLSTADYRYTEYFKLVDGQQRRRKGPLYVDTRSITLLADNSSLHGSRSSLATDRRQELSLRASRRASKSWTLRTITADPRRGYVRTTGQSSKPASTSGSFRSVSSTYLERPYQGCHYTLLAPSTYLPRHGGTSIQQRLA
jgi:hypothetical protein